MTEPYVQRDLTGASSATFSLDRRYRYTLRTAWAPDSFEAFNLNLVLFVMLNPSTADAFTLDPTVRRCVGFAKRWGYGGLLVGNLYALRSTDPRLLKTVGLAASVGPDNDLMLHTMVRMTQAVVVAWGGSQYVRYREAEVARNLLAEKGVSCLYSLGTTKEGHPRHPLYVPGTQKPELWA